MNIQVSGVEADAVRLGDIRGDVYGDGEVWAEAKSLEVWRFENPTLARGQLSPDRPRRQ